MAASAPLFSAVLNYRHNPIESVENAHALDGIRFLEAEERTNYPFTLSVEDFGQALGLTAQVVRPFPAERVCAYMQQVLHQLADALECAPHTPVRELAVLPSSERELLLQTWNRTETPYPAEQCIHELFEQQSTANTCGATRFV
ncbi:hypothetical protein P3T43_007278 [Paraburkholderia sp. GAS41]|uniref:hypothetical protein n=1 Tax=Paraburkholderia sp. GAS41 TaxID=3035134 RepID=UPI003D22E3AE